MKPSTIIVTILLLIVAVVFVTQKNPHETTTLPINNVSIVNGKQIIEIQAKGGFLPRKSVAQAGIPTAIRFDTNGTFDCSSSVRIPKMNIDKLLPPSGSTDIDIGTNEIGTLQGTCGMGMYPFEIEFRS